MLLTTIYIVLQIGGAYHQASERAALPVSVEEKGKINGGIIFVIISACEHTKINNKLKNVFMLLGGPQNTIY
jgi:hypothetical protein